MRNKQYKDERETGRRPVSSKKVSVASAKNNTTKGGTFAQTLDQLAPAALERLVYRASVANQTAKIATGRSARRAYTQKLKIVLWIIQVFPEYVEVTSIETNRRSVGVRFRTRRGFRCLHMPLRDLRRDASQWLNDNVAKQCRKYPSASSLRKAISNAA